MEHSHDIEITDQRFEFSPKQKQFTFILIGLGIVLMLLGYFMLNSQTNSHGTTQHTEAAASEHGGGHEAHGNPVYKRIWANMLLGSYFVFLLAVGGMFFVAVKYAANAGWHVAFKRIPEAMSTFIPIGAVLLLLIGGVWGVLGAHYYHWSIPGIMDTDKILNGKKGFLNPAMYLVGLGVFFAIWTFVQRKLRTWSLQEDVEGDPLKPVFFDRSMAWSAFYLFFFAFTFSITAWLVIMSIDAHWFSTIFSVYNFAVCWVSAITTIYFILIYLKSLGYYKHVHDEHRHDLGKMMFAFSIFWTYIWISQYLLIWYANLPEEVVYYQARWSKHFMPYFTANLILNFICPFLILMTRNNKRYTSTVIVGGLCILVGKWVDLFLMIMPGTVGDTATMFHPLEIGTMMLFVGIFLYVVFSSLAKAPLTPLKHPYLKESLHHDVGV